MAIRCLPAYIEFLRHFCCDRRLCDVFKDVSPNFFTSSPNLGHSLFVNFTTCNCQLYRLQLEIFMNMIGNLKVPLETMNIPKTLTEAIRFYCDQQTCINAVPFLRWEDGRPVCPKCLAT